MRGFPRLHAALFDLGTATPRQYGGIGFAIDGPSTVITAELASRFSLRGMERLDDQAIFDLDAAVTRLRMCADFPPMCVTIEELPPQHIGLGTKTTLVLSILKAVTTLADLDLPRSALQTLSGRGGTSGVGVHAFFDGGLIIDAGHRTDPPRTYRPSSSAGAVGDIPPVIGRVSMPVAWEVTLLLPPGERRAGPDEVAFFQAATPIPDDEVHEAISLAVMGLAGSAAAEDFSTFVTALTGLQQVGFKAREVAAQPASVTNLIHQLTSVSMCGVGLSSMGPLLFAITKDSAAVAGVAGAAIEGKAANLGTFGFRNLGFSQE